MAFVMTLMAVLGIIILVLLVVVMLVDLYYVLRVRADDARQIKERR